MIYLLITTYNCGTNVLARCAYYYYYNQLHCLTLASCFN